MYWLNYFNNNFLQNFIQFDNLRKNYTEEDVLCSEYVKLFNSACELLKLYLNHKGLFQFENREIIKEAFFTELIIDGERWINALSLAEIYKTGEKNKFNNLIVSYCDDENFSIFIDLKNKFDKLKDNYE